jgi:hypothetical protein
MNEAESEYMMDWIDLHFESDVPVPPPPGKRLSSMEKRFRLHFLYNALTQRRTTKKAGSGFSFLLFIAVCVALWYAWSYIKTKICSMNTMIHDTDTMTNATNGIMPPTWNMGSTWYYVGLVAILFMIRC